MAGRAAAAGWIDVPAVHHIGAHLLKGDRLLAVQAGEVAAGVGLVAGRKSGIQPPDRAAGA